MTDKAVTARALGYGDGSAADIALMDEHHDPLHRALCAWLGVPSLSLAFSRGEPLSDSEYCLANIEEAAVLAVQRLVRTHGVGVPGLSVAPSCPSRALQEITMSVNKPDQPEQQPGQQQPDQDKQQQDQEQPGKTKQPPPNPNL